MGHPAPAWDRVRQRLLAHPTAGDVSSSRRTSAVTGEHWLGGVFPREIGATDGPSPTAHPPVGRGVSTTGSARRTARRRRRPHEAVMGVWVSCGIGAPARGPPWEERSREAAFRVCVPNGIGAQAGVPLPPRAMAEMSRVLVKHRCCGRRTGAGHPCIGFGGGNAEGGPAGTAHRVGPGEGNTARRGEMALGRPVAPQALTPREPGHRSEEAVISARPMRDQRVCSVGEHRTRSRVSAGRTTGKRWRIAVVGARPAREGGTARHEDGRTCRRKADQPSSSGTPGAADTTRELEPSPGVC